MKVILYSQIDQLFLEIYFIFNKCIIKFHILGRTKTVQKDCLDQPEIRYDSVEESVHVEQTARKTCFSRVQKN